jgi:hypothetical protein
MELRKYDFGKDFNNEEYVELIKKNLNIYKSLLSATKENLKDIDKDIVNICKQQLNVYN